MSSRQDIHNNYSSSRKPSASKRQEGFFGRLKDVFSPSNNSVRKSGGYFVRPDDTSSFGKDEPQLGEFNVTFSNMPNDNSASASDTEDKSYESFLDEDISGSSNPLLNDFEDEEENETSNEDSKSTSTLDKPVSVSQPHKQHELAPTKLPRPLKPGSGYRLTLDRWRQFNKEDDIRQAEIRKRRNLASDAKVYHAPAMDFVGDPRPNSHQDSLRAQAKSGKHIKLIEPAAPVKLKEINALVDDLRDENNQKHRARDQEAKQATQPKSTQKVANKPAKPKKSPIKLYQPTPMKERPTVNRPTKPKHKLSFWVSSDEEANKPIQTEQEPISSPEQSDQLASIIRPTKRQPSPRMTKARAAKIAKLVKQGKITRHPTKLIDDVKPTQRQNRVVHLDGLKKANLHQPTTAAQHPARRQINDIIKPNISTKAKKAAPNFNRSTLDGGKK